MADAPAGLSDDVIVHLQEDCGEDEESNSLNLVGAPGFEPGASCAQGRRATRLRYAPT